MKNEGFTPPKYGFPWYFRPSWDDPNQVLPVSHGATEKSPKLSDPRRRAPAATKNEPSLARLFWRKGKSPWRVET